MESPTFQDTSQVLLGGLLLVRVDKICKGLPDEELGLLGEVAL